LIKEDEEVLAELWSFTARLRVASIDGDETWLELGFQSLAEMGERERKGCSSRVSMVAENVFIVVQGRQPSSRASEERRWIGRLAALHRAASLLEEGDNGPPPMRNSEAV
jgi:hypothetical protein